MSRRTFTVASIVVVGLLGLVLGTISSGRAATTEVGMLALDASLEMRGGAVPCSPGATPETACYGVEGEGLVPGLGRVSESFVIRSNFLGCPSVPATFRMSGFEARLTVVGKGAIDLTVADSAECLTVEGIQALSRPFIVTGGTGAYATATGSGMLNRRLQTTQQGTDVWSGTLVVPGLAFDITAPTISGAVAKVLRAPRGAARARFTYRVTATDAVDGAVPLTCTPKSGSRFRIGRTPVSCSATDTSGNTVSARFVITVRRGR